MSGNGISKRTPDKRADRVRFTRLQNALNNVNPFAQAASTEVADIRWHGVESVFGTALQGGQGRVCLWVRTDKEHKIVERMVIKDTTPPKEAWEGDDLWLPNSNRMIPREAGIAALFGDPTNKQLMAVLTCLRQIRPVESQSGTNPLSSQASKTQDEINEEKTRHEEERLEAGTMVELPNNAEATPSNAIAHDSGIVKLLKFSVRPEKMTYRLYMEYLPYHNVEVLLGGYWDNPPHRPPEPFLWYLLYRLMLACTKMENIVGLRGD